jgi:MFS family permease
MGVGGALMWPAILGMTYTILPAERAGLAGGLIIGSAGFGNAAGPLLGGLLTDALSWRWILFLNLPIALFACFVTARAVPESRGEDAERKIDYVGIATVSTGLILLLVALDQVTDWGWNDPRVIGAFLVCAVLLAAFTAAERRAGRAALVPPDVIRNRAFASACLAVLLMSAVFFASLLYLPQFEQKILGWSPLGAGAGLLPMMGVFAVTSFVAGPLYERLGAKLVLSAGAVCLCLGSFLVSLIDAGSGFGSLVPGMIVLGLGVGLFYSSVTTAAVTALDPARASLAGGIVYMFQIAGGSIGLRLTRRSSPRRHRHGAGLTRDGAPRVGPASGRARHPGRDGVGQARRRPPPAAAGDRVVAVVRDAFASGMHWGFRLVAFLALVGLVVTVLRVGGPLRGPRRGPAGEVEAQAAP